MFAKVRAKTQLWLTTGRFVLLNIGFHQLYLQADFLVDFLGYVEFSELEKEQGWPKNRNFKSGVPKCYKVLNVKWNDRTRMGLERVGAFKIYPECQRIAKVFKAHVEKAIEDLGNTYYVTPQVRFDRKPIHIEIQVFPKYEILGKMKGENNA